jgi:hypothetical protein
MSLQSGSDSVDADGYRTRIFTYWSLDTKPALITASVLKNTPQYVGVRLLIKRAILQCE